MTSEAYDFTSEAAAYQADANRLVKLLIDRSRNLGQHHIKLDYALADDRSIYTQTFSTLFGTEHVSMAYGGVLPVYTPYVNTYKKGIYAFSLGKSKTVYIGANQYDNMHNGVYGRVIRFGRAIYNREYDAECHPAGRKYRRLYGEDTSELYLSFLFYEQFTPWMKGIMRRMHMDYAGVERLLIRKFHSKYLLNVNM